MLIRLSIIASIAIFLISPSIHAKEARTDLTILQGSTKQVITEKDFRQLQLDSIVVKDPVYNKHKRYAGYWLRDILALAGVHPDPNTTWTFRALDGYKTSITVRDVLKSGAKAFIAVADLDKEEGWEKIQQGKEWISPGPYYLVWQTPLEDLTPSVKLPWPYQMVEISINKAQGGLQKLFAESSNESGPVKRGIKVFQQNCVACHSLNLEGGTVGPELNVPKNIAEYEDRKFLKEFISNPSSFRARSKMPAFKTTLSDQEIDDVLDFLTWMGKHKN